MITMKSLQGGGTVHSCKSKNPKLHLSSINRHPAYRVDISTHHDVLCIRNWQSRFQADRKYTKKNISVRGQTPKLNVVITCFLYIPNCISF